MNKPLVAAIIGIILVVFAGVFVMMRRTTGELTTQTTSQATQTPNNDTELSEKKSIKDLLSLTSNQECTFSNLDNKTEGRVQIASGKLHGEFSSQVEEKVILSHVVSDGTFMYMWVEGQNQGSKVSMAKLADYSSDSDTSTSSDINEKVNYDCSPWIIDNSVFELDPDVTYTDYSAMMQQITGGANPQTSNSQQCASCDFLPKGEAQDQCKASLGC